MVKHDHRNKTFKPFLSFWESTTNGEVARERASYVLKPISEHHKQANKILEIGCGLGEVLANLPERYTIYGLDVEKDCIEVCKNRIPRGKFFVSSMHNFKIDAKFDAVFSVYSINFLKDFDQWKSTFRVVSKHLNRDGLFIFDVYTPKMLKDTLQSLKRGGRSTSSFREFSKGYCYEKETVRDDTRILDAEVFERLPNGLYQLSKYRRKERVYPIRKMKSALSEHFDVLEANLREGGRKILFVCRKKSSASCYRRKAKTRLMSMILKGMQNV
jgi:SAM-dependent methyltransferase